MEARADLDHRGDLAGERDDAFGRRGDPAEQLEQGALSGAVSSDDAERLSAADLEADVAKRPELLLRSAAGEETCAARRSGPAAAPHKVALGDVLAADVDRRHVRSRPPWWLPCA